MLENYKKILGERILTDVSMQKYSSFKTGGICKYFALPKTTEELIQVLEISKANNIAFTVIGNGTNLLVSDDGVDGLVICLRDMKQVTVDGCRIIAKCGNTLNEVGKIALENNLSGMETLCGIPGSIGGAVAMNAGAYGGEVKDVIESATILSDGVLICCDNDALKLAYRQSRITGTEDIVISATFQLKEDNYETIQNKMSELNTKRREKQPLNFPSAGSIFKRPKGYFAAELIEKSGLKGVSIGGAKVSDKHAGFIVNFNNASTNDIIELIELVTKTVFEKFGVSLELEVKKIGTFS